MPQHIHVSPSGFHLNLQDSIDEKIVIKSVFLLAEKCPHMKNLLRVIWIWNQSGYHRWQSEEGKLWNRRDWKARLMKLCHKVNMFKQTNCTMLWSLIANIWPTSISCGMAASCCIWPRTYATKIESDANCVSYCNWNTESWLCKLLHWSEGSELTKMIMIVTHQFHVWIMHCCT